MLGTSVGGPVARAVGIAVRAWAARGLGQLGAQLRDFSAEAVDDLSLADVRAVFGGGQVGAFGFEAAAGAGVTWD